MLQWKYEAIVHMNPEVTVNAEDTCIAAVVRALIETHPNPDALLASWMQHSSAARAEWSQRAVAIGHPGFGQEEFSAAWERWTHSLRERSRQP